MIISKEIEVKWNQNNKKYFVSKGYRFTIYGDILVVKIEHLTKRSNVKIEVKCDYCGTESKRKYRDILTSMTMSITNKYSCKECVILKRNEEYEIKQERNMLQRTDKGYWTFRENREKEIHNFIEMHGSIDSFSIKDPQLRDAIKYHDEESIEAIVTSLGYDWEKVSFVVRTSFFEDFGDVSGMIQKFIKEQDRFPTSNEMRTDLGIGDSSILYHGGMDKIREKMKYHDENDLMDGNGFRNKSSLEYMVAQYLIANGVAYKRDEFPFSESRHTCDFYLETLTSQAFYVEVWGYKDRGTGKINESYAKSRRLKEDLYKRNNLNLISLSYDEMNLLNYQQIQRYLKQKLAVIQTLVFKEFENVQFLYPQGLSDEKILEVVMGFSTDENELPYQETLSENGLWTYINEIRKRYGSYISFAKYFDKTLKKQKHEWDEESVYETFLDIVVNKREPISQKVMEKYGYMGATNFFRREYGSTSLINPKFKFYKKYLKIYTYIHEEDMKSIEDISERRGKASRFATKEHSLMAIELLKIILDSQSQQSKSA